MVAAQWPLSAANYQANLRNGTLVLRQKASGRDARELGEPREIHGAHPGIEALRIVAAEREQTEGLMRAQRQEGERRQSLRAFEPFARLERRVRPAIRRPERRRIV